MLVTLSICCPSNVIRRQVGGIRKALLSELISK